MKTYITDPEKRLLLKALAREKEICKNIDKERNSDNKTKLVPIVESLEGKFYYDRMIKQIRKDTAEEFAKMILDNEVDEKTTALIKAAVVKFS